MRQCLADTQTHTEKFCATPLSATYRPPLCLLECIQIKVQLFGGTYPGCKKLTQIQGSFLLMFTSRCLVASALHRSDPNG